VSGQLHAPAALPPGERAPSTHYIGGWVDPWKVVMKNEHLFGSSDHHLFESITDMKYNGIRLHLFLWDWGGGEFGWCTPQIKAITLLFSHLFISEEILIRLDDCLTSLTITHMNHIHHSIICQLFYTAIYLERLTKTTKIPNQNNCYPTFLGVTLIPICLVRVMMHDNGEPMVELVRIFTCYTASETSLNVHHH
jgi:hypothetical protein